MRFISSAPPTLTPLGQRLLALSRAKLAHLDPEVGGRDAADTLRRGVLVRASVRSAWASVDEHAPARELTDWRHPAAFGHGLPTLSEDEEEEEEEDEQAAEARWLDDVLSTFDDDEDHEDPHGDSWTEADVLRPADEEYDDADYASVETIALDVPTHNFDAEYNGVVLPATAALEVEHVEYVDETVVQIAAVDYDDEDDEDDQDEVGDWIQLDEVKPAPAWDDLPAVAPTLREEGVPRVAAVASPNVSPLTQGDDDDELVSANDLAFPDPVSSSDPAQTLVRPEPTAQVRPVRPAQTRRVAFYAPTDDELESPLGSTQSSVSSISDLDADRAPCECDHCEDCEQACPPLQRTLSSSSTATIDDDEDCPCRTPPIMSCEELEEAAPPKSLDFKGLEGWLDNAEPDWALIAGMGYRARGREREALSSFDVRV